MLREHPRPRGDAREDQPLRLADRLHREPLVGTAGPLEADREGLVLATEGVAGGLALRVVTEADECLGPALDARGSEQPQEEVVVRRVDVALVEQSPTLEQTPAKDDRRGRHIVAEVEIAAPTELGRPV